MTWNIQTMNVEALRSNAFIISQPNENY